MKKWFMLQMWRFQQISQIMTIGMLALTLSLQANTFMNWRGGWFSNPYLGVPFLLLVIFSVIWGISIFWDLKMKMWREQVAVTVERNPYAKEKLMAKEVLQMEQFWIPLLKYIGNKDSEMKSHAVMVQDWLDKALKEDNSLRSEFEDLLEYIKRSSNENVKGSEDKKN